MRIGFQLLSMRPGQVGGQEIFVRRLLRSALPQLGDDRIVLFLRPEFAADPDFRRLTAHGQFEQIVATPDEHYGAGFADWNRRLLAGAALDVVCFPLSFFFPRPLPIPVVLHVADVQSEYLPENFAPEQLAWRRERIPESVALADAVVTYSRFTARGLIDKLDAHPDRLRVIPHGGFTHEELSAADTGPRWGAELTTAHGATHTRCPFIYYPAADWPHKNHETLLLALARLAGSGRPEHLILTGMLDQRGDHLRALAARLGIAERVHFYGCVPQAQVIELFQLARVLAFPSRFEGFGLPLVEAMQLGCPIIASDAPGVVETVGDAAEICRDDADDWATALRRVLSHPTLQDDLVRRGYARAAMFDWSSTAAAHLEVMRSAALGAASPASRQAELMPQSQT